ncbi:MAG TPA: hypothetical protein VK574_07585 [Terracidiphilus sp.]|nr:hypothetical protein [Terracidiphilus sp.]
MSLEKVEDEVIGGVLLVALLALAYFAFRAWKGLDGSGGVIVQLLKKLWNAVDGVFSKSVDALTISPLSGEWGSGVDSVHTGSTLGPSTDPLSTSDYAPDESIDEEPLQSVPLPSSPLGG